MEKLLKKGHFILLNGGSSAGKSTLVEHFQNYAFEHDKTLYVTLGIDSAFHVFPKNIFSPYLRNIRKEMMFDLVNQGTEDKPYPVFEHTDQAHAYVKARYKAITQFLDSGFSVICDEQFWHKPWIDALMSVFAGYTVYLVKVIADEKTLLEREANRANRAENLYLSSADICHQYIRQYDLEIDTTNNDTSEHIKTLWDFIEKNPKPKALQRLIEASVPDLE